jgi:hypothetical protein
MTRASFPVSGLGDLRREDLRIVGAALAPVALCLGLLAGDELLVVAGALGLSFLAVRVARVFALASGAVRLAAAEICGAVALIAVGGLAGRAGLALAGLALAEANLAVMLALRPGMLQPGARSSHGTT